MTNEDAVEGAINSFVGLITGEKSGKVTIDVLCCFAGIVQVKPALETELGLWKKILDVNVTGSMICAKAVAKSSSL